MLELKKVYFTVQSNENDVSRNIIDGITFKFEDGKFYAITGPNGSGKTTLAKLIMGINPLSGGSIIFNDHDISSLSVTDRAKLGIAYSFQQPARFKGITFRDLLSIATGTDEEKNYWKLFPGSESAPFPFWTRK